MLRQYLANLNTMANEQEIYDISQRLYDKDMEH